MRRVIGWLEILAATSLLVSCATPYQRLGRGGGYLEQRLEEDEYEVTFRANGYTSPEAVHDLALLRAADIGRRLGFTHFVVLGEHDASLTHVEQTGTTSTTRGSVSSDGSYAETTETTAGTSHTTQPGLALHVKYFDAPPAGRYLEVHEVARTLDDVARRRGVELPAASGDRAAE